MCVWACENKIADGRASDQDEIVPVIDKVHEPVVSRGGLDGRTGERVDNEKVLCFCWSDCESGEMACNAKFCSGCFHF